MWETWVLSLAWEDPLEKEMAPHSSTLAWKIPWTEKPGGLQPMGSQKSPTQLKQLNNIKKGNSLNVEFEVEKVGRALRLVR